MLPQHVASAAFAVEDAAENEKQIGQAVQVDARGIADADVTACERLIDRLEADLPPLTRFILPAGSLLAAQLHFARTVCRRAERSLVALSSSEKVADPARIYLNRLSDLLFVLGRVLNREGGRGDVLWQQGKNR